MPEGRAPGSGPWDVRFEEEARAMVTEMATVIRPVSPNGEQRPLSAGTRAAQRRSSLHAGESKMGVLMVIPTVAGIVVFTAGPIVASFALSHVILACAFAISCFSFKLGVYRSSSSEIYRDRLCDVFGRNWLSDKMKNKGGRKRRVASKRLRDIIQPVRVATPT